MTLMTQRRCTVLFATLLSLTACRSAISEMSMEELAQLVTTRRHEFIHDRLGWEIEFHIQQSRPETGPNPTYASEVAGVLRLRWPDLYVKFVADTFVVKETFVQTLKDHVREASYNFENGGGYAREGNFLAQRCNYRHVFTAQMAYPLAFQFFQESNQVYSDSGPSDDKFIPASLESAKSRVKGTQDIGGVDCIVVTNGAHDSMYFAPSLGYALVGRKRSFPTTSTTEEFAASDFRNIGVAMKFPFQMMTVLDKNGERHERRLTVNAIRRGQLSDNDFQVSINEGIQVLEDHVEHRRHQRGQKFSTEAHVAAHFKREQMQQELRAKILGAALLILAISLAIATRRLGARRH